MNRLIWSIILLFSVASFVACKKKADPPKKRDAAPAKRDAKKPAAPAKRAPAKRAAAGGVEGKYTLDTKKMMDTMKAQIAKLPKKERGMAGFVMAIVSQMKMSLNVLKGGVVEVTTTKPPNPFKKKKTKPVPETVKGTWKKDGDAYIFTSVQTKRKRKKTQVMKCTLSGTTLACEEVKKKKRKSKMKMVLFFNKA